ncbi:acetyltransferase [Desulfosediminicola ganghwensis]|uniref:acetyltransferase n=1 Tax=Desulfosediminicola ganghwensis TaxID=2569540 RepID=UPI0010ACAA31|nr:acetyltransferase [Desulfosediminicola ganghwensis]
MKKGICIIGTGGFAREVLCLIDDLGRFDEVSCFMEPDDLWGSTWKDKILMEKPVWPQSQFNPGIHTAIIGIGAPRIREKVVQQLPQDTAYETLVHPSAVISRWVDIGEGSVICAGCILTCNIKLGKQTQLNIHTTIGHDCELADYFTSAPSVNISGNCHFGKYVYFGTAAAVRQGITICDDVVIGMGGVVVKNIEDSGVYVGNPVGKLR